VVVEDGQEHFLLAAEVTVAGARGNADSDYGESERIAGYKAPHAMVIHDIPRTSSGKIQKHVLRAELAARNA
jgi:acyl-coenzyme A synthetase/AMP-(fatty) acid ligase